MGVLSGKAIQVLRLYPVCVRNTLNTGINGIKIVTFFLY